jgi:hypothetical protein
VNLLGAAGAAQFARASLQYYLDTHRLIGAASLVEQAWFMVAFLTRRQPQAVSRRLGSWLLAAAGTRSGVIEIMSFRLAPGTDEAAFIAADRRVQQLLYLPVSAAS